VYVAAELDVMELFVCVPGFAMHFEIVAAVVVVFVSMFEVVVAVVVIHVMVVQLSAVLAVAVHEASETAPVMEVLCGELVPGLCAFVRGEMVRYVRLAQEPEAHVAAPTAKATELDLP
jgi:ABC-type transport system involved in cytochrome bd biosynthesis fused ATPase/permease subunit